jgi:hypothetical protein
MGREREVNEMQRERERERERGKRLKCREILEGEKVSSLLQKGKIGNEMY